MISKNKNSIIYAICGHIYEHYENTLFSFMAPFISCAFFSNTPENRIGIYIALSAGFISRPLGSIFFSWIGDTFGRKKALIYSVTFCIIPSTILGVLPPYAMIGFLAPVFLILSRILQGISVGGSFYATITLVSETSDASKKNLLLGITISMGFFGALIGTATSSYFLSPTFPTWFWRIPFLIGGIAGLALFLMRNRVVESEEWESSEHSKAKVPFFEALKQYPKNIFSTFFMGMGLLSPFYLAASWLPGHIKDVFHLTSSYNLLVTSGLMIICGLSIIFFSWLTHWVSPKRMLLTSSITGIFCFYALNYALSSDNYTMIFMAQITISIQTALQCAGGFLLIQTLFPTKYKFSGFAVPFSLGQASLMGATPLICELIKVHTNTPSNVSYLLILSSVLIGMASLLARSCDFFQK